MSLLTFATRHVAGRVLPDHCYRQRITDPARMPSEGRRTGPVRVHLTFDDGPHPDLTPRVLDTLAASHARASFFVTGAAAEHCPHLVCRMLEEGHTVGSHTWGHERASLLPPREFLQDALRGRAAVEAVTGRSCPLFRPPFGELTPISLFLLLRHGFQVVRWSVEPKDTNFAAADEFDGWFHSQPLSSGDVILLHDTCPLTVDRLPDLLSCWRYAAEFAAVGQAGV